MILLSYYEKRIFKKFVATFAFLGIIAIPMIAYASSYTSTLYFNTTLTGATRYYNGSDISISANLYTTGVGYNSSQYYTVSLYKKIL